MMSRIKPRCIDQPNAVQNLPRFTVLKRRSVKRDAVLSYGLSGTAINQAILAGQLHRVHIAPGQLRGFCFGFTGRLLKIVEMQPVTFAADVVGDAVIRARRFAIPVDFYNRGAAFYENWKPSSFRFHGA